MASLTERRAVRSTRAAVAGGEVGESPIHVPRYFRWKSIPDRVVAALLLVPATPVLLLTVLLVRLNSPGPGIYRQVRVGLRGKTFTMYKIRTMRVDAEARSGPTWATSNDPRLTRLGRFLRSIHLDELPQLFNVIKGDMDLVGPRPERPEFTQLLAREVDGYLQRLRVRPGVTGLAQINLPPDSDFNSVRRKLVLDLEYIRAAGAGLDMRILCWTALRMCGFKSATTKVLGLLRTVSLPADNDPPTESGRETEAIRVEMADTVAKSHHGNGHSHNGSSPHRQSAFPAKPR